MSKAAENESSAGSYKAKLSILTQAAIGVIMTRSREPYRTIETVRELAFRKSRPFQVWDCVNGWVDQDPDKVETDWRGDGVVDPVKALKTLSEASAPPNGFFAMLYPHWAIAKSPHMIQYLRMYSRQFSESRQRLVMVVPQEFSLPSELEDEITVLDFDVPTVDELDTVYDEVIETSAEAKGVDKPSYTEDQRKRIVSAGQGITQAEFENAVARTIVSNDAIFPNIPYEVFVRGIMESKTDVVKRSQVLEVMPSEDISQIGGLDLLKDWIKERAACYSEEAKEFGIEAPKGCALIGPPGTGKSLSMKVVANILGVPLIRFDVGKVFNKYVGESEGRVRSALKMLEAMAPCVAFIDEVDKAGLSAGGGGDGGVGTRVLGQILTFMQESKAPIFWGFSANRVKGVDSALLRKGRLDEVFSVTVPNALERMEIFKIHLLKRRHDPEEITDLATAVEASENYVSAELESAVKDALIKAFHQNETVTGALIAQQLENMKPISEAFAEDFQSMQQWAEQNAKPSSSAVCVTTKASRLRSRRRSIENN